MDICELTNGELLALISKLIDENICFVFEHQGCIWVSFENGNYDTVVGYLGEIRSQPAQLDLDVDTFYYGVVGFPGDEKQAEAIVKLVDARVRQLLREMK